MFVCSESAPRSPRNFTVALSTKTSFTYRVMTSSACPTFVPGGESGESKWGTTFLIYFCLVLVLYIAGGCYWNRRKHGLAGTQACPQVDFWRDLPSLVIDGNVFFWSRMPYCRNFSCWSKMRTPGQQPSYPAPAPTPAHTAAPNAPNSPNMASAEETLLPENNQGNSGHGSYGAGASSNPFSRGSL